MKDFDGSRRRFGQVLVVGIGAIASGAVGANDLVPRSETPNMVVGPFYPRLKPTDHDADLTRVRGRNGKATGLVVAVDGRVLNRRGEPLPDVRIEIWQANSFGRYSHPSDPNTGAAIDPHFDGYAVLKTDRQGAYRFLTVKPGPYPSRMDDSVRAPHIHFDVQGRIDRKVTQMFFPGEPLNEQDPLLRVVRGKRESLVASHTNPGVDGISRFMWDIVLATG